MLKNILLGAALAAGAVTASHAMIIDTFSEAPQEVQIFGPEARTGADKVRTALDNAALPAGAAGAAKGSIIGGYRDIKTSLHFSPSGERKTTAAVDTDTGSFVHSQDARVESNSYITWNGLAGAGLHSADLTDGGIHDLFHLAILYADHGARWSLQLFDRDSNFTYVFDNTVEISTRTDIYIPFSLFTGIDMTDINKIVFGANITNIPNLDTEVDFFRTTSIPEPASVAVMGAGLMGLGAMIRRRQDARRGGLAFAGLGKTA